MQKNLTLLKLLLVFIAAVTVSGYVVYQSDWFQKTYLYPFPYQAIVYQSAAENDVDPMLIAGVIRAESKFVADARSPKGAVGLMQMMPETASWAADQQEWRDFSVERLTEPEINIRLGTWYLASLRKEFGGNEILMLAAYNGGRGNVKQWMRQYGWDLHFSAIEQIPFRETRDYVGRVLAGKKKYQELYH